MTLTILAALLCLSAAAPGRTQALTPASPTARIDTRFDARIEPLLKQMTLEEKIGQLNQLSSGIPFGPKGERMDYEALISGGHVGSMLNIPDGKQARTLQRIAVEKSRLKIPLIIGLDVVHGYRTTFPVPLGLSATWNPELVEQTCRVAAQESTAQGVRWTFSPMVDIARDARWGRIAESAGEDPYLGSVLARAYVRGYQGTDLADPSSMVACAKHFAGYGASEAGRDYNTTEISERLLRQVYLPPFQAAVEEGAGSLMAAFNALNGVPASSNAFLMDQVLRKEWGFHGLVVSDYASIRETMAHGIANDGATAARKSLTAGLDMDMGSMLYQPELPALVKSGAVPEAKLDEAVRRVLRLKFALGLFERPYPTGEAAEGPLPAAYRQLARKAAEESFVLLRNEATGGRPLLPLQAAPGRKIALVGPHADDAAEMLGSWAIRGRAEDVVTLRAALAERAAQEKMDLVYAKGAGILEGQASDLDEAVAAARKADAVVVTLGEKAEYTGEATSRAYLDLPPHQQKLLEALAATGKPIALVLFNGRPLTLTWAAQHIPAILVAWSPGTEAGPALVRTLFGDVNPSGRLTATFPRSVGQEPLYYNALNTGRPAYPGLDLSRPPKGFEASRWVSRYIDELNAPLYPFGYGLSYTTFQYSPARVSAQTLSAAALNGPGSTLKISADITNTGSRKGSTVAQLYIRLRGTSVARPVRELKGFQRLELAPGETRGVSFEVGKEALAFWNLDMKLAAEPAALSLWIAPDSASGDPVEVRITD